MRMWSGVHDVLMRGLAWCVGVGVVRCGVVWCAAAPHHLKRWKVPSWKVPSFSSLQRPRFLAGRKAGRGIPVVSSVIIWPPELAGAT